MVFPVGVIAGVKTRSIGDQWNVLWEDIKELWRDVADFGIQEAFIDWIRAEAGLPEINHEKDDRSFWEKLDDTIFGVSALNEGAEGDLGSQVGMIQAIWDNARELLPGEYEGTLEIIEARKKEEEVATAEAAAAAEIENTLGEANRVVSELLGSDRNWQRFFNFLTSRDVMMLGPSTNIDTLQEIWNAVADTKFEGLPEAQGADSLNLSIPGDVEMFRDILWNTAIYERQFGPEPGSEDEKADVIDSFIETVRGRTNFVVVGGMANSLLQGAEGVDIGPAGQLTIPSADPEGQAAYERAKAAGKTDAEAQAARETAKQAIPVAERDFFIPTFDGTAQGVIRGVGDLIAGMSINPQEVQDRLNALPRDQLALVQTQLWQFGYFDTVQGPEDFQWGVSEDSTYRATERMLVDLLGHQRDFGPDYSVNTMLTDRRRDRARRFRGEFIGTEMDEKRQIRDSVLAQVSSGMSGPVNDALQLALDESGVTLTAKGHSVFKEKIEEAIQTVGMTQPELEQAYQEGKVRDDAEMLLAAYYTDGSYVGDWSGNVTVGGNTDADWADFGIMAGAITQDEANLLYTPLEAMTPTMNRARSLIRQKLEENEVDIVRAAMNWWLTSQTYTDTTTGQQVVSHVDALKGFANTIGRYTASMNGYDDRTFNQLAESLTGPVASQWLLDEVQGDTVSGDVADRIAQSAVDALGLPDAAPDISGAGSIRSVLRAIAGTGTPRGLRYG